MTRCCRTAALVVLAVCSSGCLGSWRQGEILESRLRQQEDTLYAIRSELDTKSAELAATRRELAMLRTQQSQAEQVALPAEHVMVVTRAAGIQFHSLLTRPLDRDGVPGDDLLNVVVTPHDAEGETVKLPGGLRLELLDLSRAEGERVVAAWNFKPEEMREQWHSGFIATGYRFELPWPASAPSGKLMLLARFMIEDGRHFEATQEIVSNAPSTPGQIVDGSGGAVSPGDAPGPALLEPTTFSDGFPSTAHVAPTGEPPTFELPELDTADQKAADEPPVAPRELPWIDAVPVASPPPALPEPNALQPAASTWPPTNTPSPTNDRPIVPLADDDLQTSFGPSRTEYDSDAPPIGAVMAPSPFQPPPALDDDRVVKAAPLPGIAGESPAATTYAPDVVLPLDGVAGSERKSSSGSVSSMTYTDPFGTAPQSDDRPRRFYRSGSVAEYAPTMVLSPIGSESRKPDAGAGVARVSGE